MCKLDILDSVQDVEVSEHDTVQPVDELGVPHDVEVCPSKSIVCLQYLILAFQSFFNALISWVVLLDMGWEVLYSS